MDERGAAHWGLRGEGGALEGRGRSLLDSRLTQPMYRYQHHLSSSFHFSSPLIILTYPNPRIMSSTPVSTTMKAYDLAIAYQYFLSIHQVSGLLLPLWILRPQFPPAGWA